jgi:pimeloyl-ACP methyl ester carboxylesterase
MTAPTVKALASPAR